MTTAFFSKNLRFVAAVILLGTSATLSAADRKFSTSTSLSTEARTLIQLLEQAHFNRDSVKSSDYTEVISAYMGDLDGQRLFFLASDKSEFEKKYGKTVYENASFLGNIDAAYQIYATYENRATTRINWISQPTLLMAPIAPRPIGPQISSMRTNFGTLGSSSNLLPNF